MTRTTITRTLATAGLLTTLTSATLEAAPVAANDVRVMAERFAAGSDLLSNHQVGQLRPLAWDADQPVFYLAALVGGGWVLASGDDALLPVIGWSDQPLPEGDLPPQLVDWLQAEEQEVLKLRARGGESEPARVRWEDLLSDGGTGADGALRTEPGDDVPPLIQAMWSQGSAWNSQCPADAAGPGGHAYVGCVAVALAQVLDYWNWPNQGQNVQSYEHSTYGQITVDFNTVSYDWDAITPAASNPDVRQLLYEAGVSVRMNYGPSGSSAQSSMVVTALRNHFRYGDTTRMVWRSSYAADTWQSMLLSELAAGRPMVYRGQGPAGGHAFNVDGVQNGTWFHINWGWSGSYNGYFELTDLSPGNYTFNSVQGAVVGIAPIGVSVNRVPVVPSLFFQCAENETITTTLVGYDLDNDPLSYRVNGQALAGDVWTWTPPLNTNGTFTFTYQACDQGGCSQPAGIVVIVSSVNQLPTVQSVALAAVVGEPISLTLAGSDPDGDALSYTVNGLPIFGNIWSWTPTSAGVHVFTYAACDGSGCSDPATITVTVLQTNQLPIVATITVETLEDEELVVQLSGHDPDGDPLTYTVNGTPLAGDLFTWMPAANFHGQVVFIYQACDGVGCSQPASLIVNVLSVNDVPQVRPVFTHLQNPGMQQIQLVAWDADGDPLTYVVDSQPIEGDVFTVYADNAGSALNFTYFVTDGVANSDTVSIELTFAPKTTPKLRRDPNSLHSGASGDALAATTDLPQATALGAAYPNPFNPATTLVFDLAETGAVRLAVYNIAGQQVAELVNGLVALGRHEVRWEASHLASGAYLVALQTAQGVETQILHLLK